MAKRKRAKRSNEELLKVLESILYEMVILATALLLRDRRYFFKEYPDLPWGLPQIAHDVIRLKSRMLLDFFYPEKNKRPHPDDVTAHDFNILIPVLERKHFEEIENFKQKINKWTVHLTLTRTREPEYSKTDRQLMEQYALDLLTIGSEFIECCLAAGFQLGMWAKRYHENFRRLYTCLI